MLVGTYTRKVNNDDELKMLVIFSREKEKFQVAFLFNERLLNISHFSFEIDLFSFLRLSRILMWILCDYFRRGHSIMSLNVV